MRRPCRFGSRIATSKATTTTVTGVNSNFDDFQYVKAGALINF